MYKKPAFWAAAFAVATLTAVTSVLLLHPAYAQYKKEAMDWGNMLKWQLTWWYVWLPILPFIFYLSQRFRLDTPDWIKNIFIHIPAATVLSLIHLGFYVYATFLLGAQKWLDVPNSKMSATQEYFYLVSTPIHVNFRTRFALYAGIVLMVHVMEIYRRSEREELKELQLEKKLARAKLQALKMQLHPHFLFNTLHSISALIYKDIHGAEEMIDRLMKFLALTLENNGPQTVTLQKELEFLQCYLDIETVRFHDRLTVQMDIEPAALHSKVPNLITQPIVENAIRHGIATRTTAGRITIRARIENGQLRLQVLDNGPGFSGNGNKEGLGLTNTRARLQQLYGERHRLEFSNDSSGGLAVMMEIPSETEPLLDSSPQHISA